MSALNLFKSSKPACCSSRGTATESSSLASVRPQYSITDSEDAYHVDVDLPGVTKEDLEITLREGLLEIIGRRSGIEGEGWKSLDGKEEALEYRLRLMAGDRVEGKAISANLEAGVLRIALPKEEEKKPRKIDIN